MNKIVGRSILFGVIIFLSVLTTTLALAQEIPPKFLFKWGSFGSGDGQFNNPIYIAGDSTGNIYVSDSGNNRIQKFASDGIFITRWGSFGSGDGQFFSPSGIAVDSGGNVYVAELNNNRIQKFTNNGVFISKWGSVCRLSDNFGCVDPDGNGPLTLGDGEFLGPSGIAIDSSGAIYVADSGNQRIQKFTSTGVFIAKWGTLCVLFNSLGCVDPDGNGPLTLGDGQFDRISGITVDSLSNVYVSDASSIVGASRIQKFDSNGNFINKWSVVGRTAGITVDSFDNIYVAVLSDHVEKFTSSGVFLTKWGSFCNFFSNNFGCIDPDGSGPLELGDGQFLNPGDISINSPGNIYVTDSHNNRIQVFGILIKPTLSNFGQSKSDGVTVISESGTTTESTVVFKAMASDPNNDQVKLQVEPKPFSQLFDGTNLIESSFVSSGSEATTTKEILVNGQYHWRARAVDVNGNASNWQEFGITGNVDFAVKLVPLYTQIISPYPSETETSVWAPTDYAEGVAGNYDCGSTIANCGCAITSAVMLLRYYGITKGADGLDITPGNINAWLNAHQGYIKGSIKWPKVWEYSAHPQNTMRLQFDGAVNFKDTATLDQYVQALKPTILHNRSFGHFLVADGKLSATHTVKDSAFYNTKYLAATETAPFVRNYNNHFDGLRLFSTSTAEVAGIYLSVASPAELLVTDPNGQRSGKNPVTGIVYDEIPGGSYFQEGLSNDALETPPPPKEVKHLWIPQPVSGQYNIKVIGTDSGSYVFDSLAYDAQGQSHTQTFSRNTQSALVSEYNLNFTPQQPENIAIQLVSERIDECPTINGDVGNSGCPAKIELLSLEKISNSAGVPELVGLGGAVRYTAPVVEGQRGTTEVRVKLYDETALLGLLGNPKRIPLDQLCAIFDDSGKDATLTSHLMKTTNTEGRYFFGVPSATTTYALIESVKETIAGQAKRVCVLETILPRHFDRATNIASKEVNKITVTTRKTHTGEILVEKRAGHTSQILLMGESLWSLMKNILGYDSPAKIYNTVRKFAEFNNITIPEWGLYGGQIDAKKLRAGLIIDASLFEE